MKINFEFENQKLYADLSKPLDISIPLKPGSDNPNAFYAPDVKMEPVRAGSFVGSVAEGGVVNFMNVVFNPHGNGTHTECVGHISKEKYIINESLKQFFFIAKLITIEPAQIGSDKIITKEQVVNASQSITNTPIEALILRTLPNSSEKLSKNYSGTNPAYLDAAPAFWMRENGIKHLLIDLPSVDREEDEGKLSAHKAFWNYPEAPRTDATITELIYVPDSLKDGLYLLNLQIASLEMDAAPSKPVLYALTSK